MSYISVNYTGGLGNQLFYIAAGYYYSKKYNKELILPNKNKTGDKLHEQNILNTLFKNQIKLIDENNINDICNIIIDEKQIDNNINILISSNIMLTGMFQKRKYADFSKNYIFNVIKNSEYYNYAIKHFDIIKIYFNDNDINNYLFIHVRRNDFLEDYSATNIQYYNEAIKVFSKDIKIIMFSDDIIWCKNNFNFHNIYYIDDIKYYDNEIKNTYIEFSLMTMINNGILSESTFAWWAAILRNENKTIVVPKHRSTILYDNLDDVYLEKWIQIDCKCHL